MILLVFSGSTLTAKAKSNPTRSIPPAFKTEYTKKINKEFSIDGDGEVALSNKYGKVNVTTWSKNKVQIDVTITVKARSQSAADDFFKKVTVNFTDRSDYVRAETSFDFDKKSWWSGGDDYNSYQIDYQVSMPKGCSLELFNKYGHSKVGELDGRVSADIKYGNIYLEGVNEEVKLILGYGEGTIVKAKDVEVDVKYSKININKASDIDVMSKYSKVYIDLADDVKSESKYDSYRLGDLRALNNEGKYDNFEIRTIDLIKTTTKYTDFEVETLRKEGAFTLEHGNIAVRKLLEGFTSLNLTGKYANFKIGVDKGANYSLDVEAEHGSVRYPDDLNVTYEKSQSGDYILKGTKGGSGGTIRARVEYGGVKVY